MSNKGFLHDMGGWSQFFFFCFISFFGLIVASFVLVLTMDMEAMLHSANAMRLAQTIQTAFMFLCPALLFAYLCQGDVKSYLKIDTGNRNLAFLLLCIILIIAIQPLITAISHYNQQITLPESMAPIEQWMKGSEQSAEKTIKLLFEDRTASGLIFNLLVIALVAGLAEEFFFRGCLQQIIQKISGNPHIAIWVAAIIFSAVHLQFYGFVPRVLLGALLGYLYLWSGNIWVPVIIHTIHNALNVIVAFIFWDTPALEQIENFAFTGSLWLVSLLVITSIFLPLIILCILYRNRINDLKSEN